MNPLHGIALAWTGVNSNVTTSWLATAPDRFASGLFAHQGGWDEALLVGMPLALIGLLLWVANRRVSAQLRTAQGPLGTGHSPDDDSPDDHSPDDHSPDDRTRPADRRPDSAGP